MLARITHTHQKHNTACPACTHAANHHTICLSVSVFVSVSGRTRMPDEFSDQSESEGAPTFLPPIPRDVRGEG